MTGLEITKVNAKKWNLPDKQDSLTIATLKGSLDDDAGHCSKASIIAARQQDCGPIFCSLNIGLNH